MRSVGEETVWPSTLSMVSPVTTPALPAAEPESTWDTTAPDEELPVPLLPAPLPDPKLNPPEPSPEPELLLSDEVEMPSPRKPVAPMWTVEDACPSMILWATDRAVLIGME